MVGHRNRSRSKGRSNDRSRSTNLRGLTAVGADAYASDGEGEGGCVSSHVPQLFLSAASAHSSSYFQHSFRHSLRHEQSDRRKDRVRGTGAGAGAGTDTTADVVVAELTDKLNAQLVHAVDQLAAVSAHMRVLEGAVQEKERRLRIMRRRDDRQQVAELERLRAQLSSKRQQYQLFVREKDVVVARLRSIGQMQVQEEEEEEEKQVVDL